MDTVATRIGDDRILIEAVPTGPPLVPAAAQDEWGTIETRNKPVERLADSYSDLKTALREISADLGSTFASRGDGGPSTIEVSFGLTLSADANVWVLRAGGEVALTVTLTWDRP
ncbi:MAG TPA: CU044_2847 family protein [Jatrophihabitantaceae bacterium]|jgi:hypothetical protein